MQVRTTLLLASFVILAACGDRGRPLPPELNADVELDVRVLAPVSNRQPLLAGEAIQVQVRAQEHAGRVHGAGFVARRLGSAVAVDSAVLMFDPVSDTTVAFTLIVPDTLPPNTQLDIYGLAFGPGTLSRLSSPQHLTVVVCPPNATWC